METLNDNDIVELKDEDIVEVPQKGLLSRIGSKIASTSEPVIQGVSNLNQYLGEKAVDFSKAASSGASMGLLDEAGGVIGGGIDAIQNKLLQSELEQKAPGFELPEKDLASLYRENQQRTQRELEAGHERSPVVSMGGELFGGAMTGGATLGALGVGAKTAPSLAGIAADPSKMAMLGQKGLNLLKAAGTGAATGGVLGATTSKEGGLLTEEERSKLLGDIGTGAATGGVLSPVLQGVIGKSAPLINKVKGSFNDYIENTPILRQMGVSHGYGLKGINPKDQKQLLNTKLGETGLTELDNTRTLDLVKEIQAADARVGQHVGASLQNATNSGKIVNIAPDLQQSLSQIKSLAGKYPELVDNRRVDEIFGKIANTRGDITPLETKELIDTIDAYIGKFKGATNKTPTDLGVLENLFKSRELFSNTLKNQVPEYAQAAERFAEFRRLVPETMIAGSTQPELLNQSFGKVTNQELGASLKPMLQGATREGSATAPIRENFVQSIKGLKTFEQQEAQRLSSGQAFKPAFERPVSTIEDQIKKYSDDAVARSSIDALHPQTGITNLGKQLITGTGETGRSVALSAANLAGRVKAPIMDAVTKNPLATLSRSVYNAPNETIGSIASKLKGVPGLEKYGNQLEHALASPDQNKRNQVLFTIMQNPSARSFVDEIGQEEPQQ